MNRIALKYIDWDDFIARVSKDIHDGIEWMATDEDIEFCIEVGLSRITGKITHA
jgi:hypothetical protein